MHQWAPIPVDTGFPTHPIIGDRVAYIADGQALTGRVAQIISTEAFGVVYVIYRDGDPDPTPDKVSRSALTHLAPEF